MNAKKIVRHPDGGMRAVGSREQADVGATQSATVLVVDDEDEVRESTAAILRLEGFEVLEAADAPAATWLLASEGVDVLLLDLHLCRLDGTAVLKSLEVSSTVVIFSGFGDVDETDIRREFGPVVFECLRKPVPPDQLVEVIAAAAEHARERGREPRVRPISPGKALQLAMAGLARLTPETERDGQTSVIDSRTHPGTFS